MENYSAGVPATSSSISWTWILTGLVVAGLVGLAVWLGITYGKTRPIVQGFYAPPTVSGAIFPCSGISSEASALVATFESKKLAVGEEGSADLNDLRNLMSKLSCMKQDLMSVAGTVSAVKELQFHTHQDIQPVADLTGRCFAKTVPERDLDIQFDKWHSSGKDLIRRLCGASEMSEAEVVEAETLFEKAWKDSYEVARSQCLKGPVDGAFKTGPHDPAPREPETVQQLRGYDGLY